MPNNSHSELIASTEDPKPISVKDVESNFSYIIHI